MSADEWSDRHLAQFALMMWANVVETGDPHLSAADAANPHLRVDRRVLTPDQQRFVLRLRDLSKRLGSPCRSPTS